MGGCTGSRYPSVSLSASLLLRVVVVAFQGHASYESVEGTEVPWIAHLALQMGHPCLDLDHDGAVLAHYLQVVSPHSKKYCVVQADVAPSDHAGGGQMDIHSG